MNKGSVLLVGAALLLSSCGTYTGSGAYGGATLGSIFGSAIGGIGGGPRGSDVGTVVGMAGGAIIGGVIGAQADKAQQQKYEDYKNDRRQRNRDYGNSGYDAGNNDDSGFDPSGSGDDVLYDYDEIKVDDKAPEVHIGAINAPAVEKGTLEIRNLHFTDADNDGTLYGGETGKVVFEVYNNSSAAYYDIQPVVEETTGNKRIYISGSIRVEKILPGRGIRYTAMIKADKRVKDGLARFSVYAAKGNDLVTGVLDFSVPTAKKQ